MSDRRIRVESLIRELAATFIQQEANTDPLITVTNVTSSSDYRKATIFFTTVPEGREADAQIFLSRFAKEIRHHIKKKSNLKIIPFIEFQMDAGERHRQHIDELVQETGVESTFEELKNKSE